MTDLINFNGHKPVLEAQKSSQASSYKKGLQPEIANRVRVSMTLTACHSKFFA